MAYNGNESLRLAYELVENTGATLFLTGKAGTGKTTFLQRLREKSCKRIVVLAPTGIAAINAGGQTIHSFFQLSFAPFVAGSNEKRYERFSKEKLRVIRTMDLLVIDEISMVRADLLDAVDDVLRRHRDPLHPFGGVQLLMIGDLAQLPPVVKDDEWQLLKEHYSSPYFFSSRSLSGMQYETVELDKVYRQSEGLFLDILNRIRDNTADPSTLQVLNRRYMPDFNPDSNGEKWIRLVTHNHQARSINEASLAALPGKETTFRAKTEGDFPETSYPADESLTLKPGAQVMFIKNDTSGDNRYYNGMLGIVMSLGPESVTVAVEDGGELLTIGPETWKNTKYTIGADQNIKEEEIGEFSQIPLRKAWAITIHKSQGLTFDRAIIDASASFTHGQTYVALSRCRTLEGLVLDAPLSINAIICDSTVVNYIKKHTETRPDEKRIAQLKDAYLIQILDDLFNFTQIIRTCDGLMHLLEAHFSTTYPRLTDCWKNLTQELPKTIGEIAAKFHNQYGALICAGGQEEKLNERIRSGATYFLERANEIKAVYNDTPIDHDSKEITKRLRKLLDELHEQLRLKIGLLEYASTSPFNQVEYLKKKAMLILEIEKKTPQRGKHKQAVMATGHEGDITNPGLFGRLRQWRMKVAESSGVPPFVVAHNKVLINIANSNPQSIEELADVAGVGAKFMQKYGNKILEICSKNS